MPQVRIGGLIRLRAKTHPDQTAITSERESVTWSELYLRASRFANALRSSGVGSQDRVSLVEHNGIEHFEFIFGCALLNVIPVPLNWRLSPVEIKATLEDARPKLVIVGPDFNAAIEEIAPALDPALALLSIGAHKAWRSYTECETPPTATTRCSIPPLPMRCCTSIPAAPPASRKASCGAPPTPSHLLPDTSVHYGLREADVSLLCMPLIHSGGTSWPLAE